MVAPLNQSQGPLNSWFGVSGAPCVVEQLPHDAHQLTQELMNRLTKWGVREPNQSVWMA